MASSLPVKTQQNTPLNTSANEGHPVTQEEAQNVLSNELLMHFVGASEPGDQQKALDFFNQ